MNWFKTILGFDDKSNSQRHGKFTIREGDVVQTDEVFEAWTSGDLERMLKVVNSKTNPIDRHFLLQNIVNESYRQRKEERYEKLCIKYSELHLNEVPDLIPALKKDMDGTLPRISTFQNYSTILTELGDFDKAIQVCKTAISYGLSDGTKSGFDGRIERIRKKQTK